MRLMSISRVGRASRIAIIGTSVCPPAMTRALVVGREQRTGFVDVGGAGILERCCFHGYATPKPGYAIVLLCPAATPAPRGAGAAILSIRHRYG